MERTARHAVAVSAVRALTPKMRRITVTGATLAELQPTLLQDVAIVLSEHGQEARRRYTVCNYRETDLDIDAVLHGHGPGSAWASTVEPGDEAVLYGPRAGAPLAQADWYLLVADEAGLPAVAELLRVLEADRCTILGEIDNAAEQQDLRAATVLWLPRDGAESGTSELFVSALQNWEPPAGAGAAYVLTESRVASVLRAQLIERGLARHNVHAKGYWTKQGRLRRPM